jgi:long-chain acyl-CoA synthetase
MSSSPGVPPPVPTRSNIAFLEHENLERYGNYTRLHYEGKSFSNVEELQYAGKIAASLRDRGIRPGDRVLTVMPNTPQLTATFQAVWTIGATIVPVNPLWSVSELAYAIYNSGAAAVLTFPQLAKRVADAAAGSAISPRLLCFGPSEVADFADISGDIATAHPVSTPVDRAASDVAMLLYTSGTTARPKGVMVTHANIPAAIEAVHRVNPALPRHPILHVLPMNHVFGVLMIQLSNRWGMPSVLMRQFDPVQIFKAIQEHKIGYVLMVPTMLVYLLHHPERPKYDFSSLYRIITGGSSLPESLRQNFQQAFRCRVDQGYGMSETGFISCYGDHEAYRNGSSGWPCPGFNICVVDDQGRPLPPPTVGEIWIQGPSVTPGYWNDPETNGRSFRDQWFHTGDVGYQDSDGYLYITDRKKDLIIKGGENISPSEIEEVLYRHPAISEAAVVGVPDAEFGEQICAVIQLRTGATATEGEIHEHAARYIGKFKQPAYIVFQDILPRTATGKVHKQMLREQISKKALAPIMNVA